MAAIKDILTRKWPGRRWIIQGDDYSTLKWSPGNPEAKPTQAAIRSFSDEVDAEMAVDVERVRKGRALERRADAIFNAVDVLTAAVEDLQAKSRLTTTLDMAVTTKIKNLRGKIDTIKAG